MGSSKLVHGRKHAARPSYQNCLRTPTAVTWANMGRKAQTIPECAAVLLVQLLFASQLSCCLAARDLPVVGLPTVSYTSRLLLQQSQEGNCTPPRTAKDTLKPFCFQPDTISSEARQFLRSQSAGTSPGPYALLNTSDPAQQAALAKFRQHAMATGIPSAQVTLQQYMQSTRNDSVGGVPVVIAVPKGVRQAPPGNTKLMIYLHSGEYITGSCHFKLPTAAPTAAAAGLTLLCVEYRLAPEFPFPAGLNDALTVYKTLIQQQGYNPKKIVLLGDSAGGGMVVAVAIQLQREGVALPAALGLFSPWTDLSTRVDSYVTLIGIDPVASSYEDHLKAANAYVGGNTSLFADPLVSPLRADYTSIFSGGKLPPTLIQVGLRDLLLSNAVLLCHKMKAAAPAPGHVVISPYDAMWHVFQSRANLPEAQAASKEMADYFARALNGSICL